MYKDIRNITLPEGGQVQLSVNNGGQLGSGQPGQTLLQITRGQSLYIFKRNDLQRFKDYLVKVILLGQKYP